MIKDLTPKERIEEICHLYNIENYTINDDLSIDVNGNVNLTNKRLSELPIVFNNVYGDFLIGFNNLTTLKGCPKYIRGHFNARSNNIRSLLYLPSYHTIDLNSNPIDDAICYVSNELLISYNETIDRLFEFDVFRENDFDMISLNSLFDFMGKDFDRFKSKFALD